MSERAAMAIAAIGGVLLMGWAVTEAWLAVRADRRRQGRGRL